MCLGAFDDFNIVCGGRLEDKTQYIIPQLNFSCNGTVTQWKVGLEMGGGNDQRVSLETWRSVGIGEYSRVTEEVYSRRVDGERIATVSVSMSVIAGDMVGFNGQLELHTLPNVGLTLLSSEATSSTTLSDLATAVGPSPYITVDFGE